MFGNIWTEEEVMDIKQNYSVKFEAWEEMKEVEMTKPRDEMQKLLRFIYGV